MKLLVAFVTIVALMAVALMPVDMALGKEVNPVRTLPDTVERGETFDVIVTFTTPEDKFNAISITDLAPEGWNVTVSTAWCTPTADVVLATGNRADIAWYGELGVGFDNGTSFSVLYKVAVPDDASTGIHTFSGFLGYYVGSSEHIFENVTGDSEVEVVLAATPIISFSPASLSFNVAEGGSNPAAETLDIWNSGIDTIIWTLSDDAEWLSENPTGGSSTGEHDTVAVSVDITGMSAGDYSAKITITADGASNSPQKVPVSLHISSSMPQISFSPGNLSFTAGEEGSNPANETLEIWNSGVDTLNWTLSDDAEWLSQNPTSGSSTGTDDTTVVTVSVNTTGMSAGDYSASITIMADGVSNSPRTVPVSLYMGEISPPPQPWLNRYWWTIVAGIVGVVILVYLLRRRRGA